MSTLRHHPDAEVIIGPKTFAETQGKKRFDWNAFLDFADRHGIQSPQINWHIADKLARSWVTCACGNQCAVIPRAGADAESGLGGAPDDRRLRNLGLDFMYEIEARDVVSARATLKKIERRSAELIATLTQP